MCIILYRNTRTCKNPRHLIYMVLLPYSSFLPINNHQQLICYRVQMLGSVHKHVCQCRQLFFNRRHISLWMYFSYWGVLLPWQNAFEIPRHWGHLINSVTYSKITFMSNTTHLQLFWLKLLRGVIKSNEFFYFENKALFRLQVKLQGRLFNHLFKLQVPLPQNIQSWKRVTDQTHENWDIICHCFWQIEVS